MIKFFIFISCLFLFSFALILLLKIWKNTKKEHLSFEVTVPKNLPKIKQNETYFLKDSFSFNQNNENLIVYVYSNDEETYKYILFMNPFFFETKNEKIIIIQQDDVTAEITRKIMKLMPNFETFFTGQLVYQSSSNDIDIIKTMKSNQRVLLPMLFDQKNKKHIDFIKRLNKIQIFDYVTMINDSKKIQTVFPTGKLSTIHMKLIFPELSQLNYMFKFMSFDKLVYIKNKKDWDNDSLNYLQKYFLYMSKTPKNDAGALNFYETMGFKTHSVQNNFDFDFIWNEGPKQVNIQSIQNVDSLKELRDLREIEKQAQIYNQQNTNNYNVIEKFEDERPFKSQIQLNPSNNLDIEVQQISTTGYKRIKINGKEVDNVFVQLGDKVHLSKQDHKVENDIYFVTHINEDKDNIFLILENSLFLSWKEESMITTNISLNNNEYIVNIQFDHPDISMLPGRKYMIKSGNYIYIDDPTNVEGSITTVYEDSFDAKVRDKEYTGKRRIEYDHECFGFEDIKTKEACNEEFSYLLREKTKSEKEKEKDKNKRINREQTRGVWDKRCEFDYECPFFQIGVNSQGKEYRGGCENGYCEMPVGVKQKSYRKFDIGPTSFPFCHGCKEFDFDNMKKCCEERIKEKEVKENDHYNVYIFH